MNADRNLLFGLLALQNDFVSRKQLLAAFGAWVADRNESLADILVQQRAINATTKDLLNKLVDQHVTLRGNEQQCLDNMSVDQSIKTELSFLADTEMLHSIDRLGKSGAEATISVVRQFPSGKRFLIVRPLDRGGLGVVSVALDKELNREVALKEIREDRADDEHLRQKFLLEAEVTGGLEHPGIVPVYGMGRSDDGRPYYAMRLVRGENLRSYIRRFHEGVAQARHEYDGQELRKLLRRFLDVCEAIGYAHARGVLHRDLKPGNVMLGQYGETLVVDWGLAKTLGVSGDSPEDTQAAERSILSQPESPLMPTNSNDDATRQGAIVGTPAYASPEQLSGDLAQVGPTSDIYGLGAILYEILTGKPPASGNLEDVLQIVLRGEIPSCRTIQQQTPKPLEAICHKALALQPLNRYRSAKAMSAEIERWLDDAPVETYREPWYLRARRWARHHPTAVSTSLAIAAMSLLGLVIFSNVVSSNNKALALLNQDLEDANSELSSSNNQLRIANDLAESQSQLALSTLTAVVDDIQNGIRHVPGGAEVRRRILATSLSKLERVATEVAGKAQVDRRTMISLADLGETISRFGSQSDDPNPLDTATSSTEKSPSEIALQLLDRSHQLALQLYEQHPSVQLAALDLAISYERLASLYTVTGKTADAEKMIQASLELRKQQLALAPDSWELQQACSHSQIRLGELVLKLRNVSEAAKLFEESLAIRLTRLKTHPDEANTQRDVAIAYEKLAEASSLMGNTASAIEQFQKSLQLLETLHKQAPLNTLYQRDLTVTHGKLAQLYTKIGETESAIIHSEHESALSRTLRENDPLNFQGILDDANALDRLAKLKLVSGQTSAGIELLEQSLKLRRDLLAQDPKRTLFARDLTLSLDRLGRELLNQGRFDSALEMLKESLAISQQHVAEDPLDNAKKRDLSISYSSVGDVHILQSNYQAALDCYRDVERIATELVAADPLNADSQIDLSVALNKMGRAYDGLQEFDLATDYLKRSIQILKSVLKTNPNSLIYQRNLSLGYEHLASMQMRIDEYEAALANFDQCRAMRQKLVDLNPKNTMWQSDLVFAESNIGRVLIALKREQEALRTLQRSISLTQRLLDNDPDNTELKDMQAINYRLVALSYHALDDMQSAKQNRLAAASIGKALVESTHENMEWNNIFIQDHRALADYAVQEEMWAEAIQFLQSAIDFIKLLDAEGKASPPMLDLIVELEENIATLREKLI